MSKTIIGYNYDQERINKEGARKKADLFRKAVEYFEHYDLKVSDLDEMNNSFVEYFRDQFDKIHGSSLPKFMSIDKKIEVTGVNLNDLRDIEERYRSVRVPFDIHTQESPEKDYNVYAETERELMLWRTANNLIKLFSDLDGVGHKIIPQRIAEVTRGLVYINPRTSQLEPNVTFIKRK